MFCSLFFPYKHVSQTAFWINMDLPKSHFKYLFSISWSINITIPRLLLMDIEVVSNYSLIENAMMNVNKEDLNTHSSPPKAFQFPTAVFAILQRKITCIYSSYRSMVIKRIGIWQGVRKWLWRAQKRGPACPPTCPSPTRTIGARWWSVRWWSFMPLWKFCSPATHRVPDFPGLSWLPAGRQRG